MTFDELMGDQGEVAFMIEGSREDWKFMGYTVPQKGKTFEDGELQNVFLAESMTNREFEDEDRVKLIVYLGSSLLGKNEMLNK